MWSGINFSEQQGKTNFNFELRGRCKKFAVSPAAVAAAAIVVAAAAGAAAIKLPTSLPPPLLLSGNKVL